MKIKDLIKKNKKSDNYIDISFLKKENFSRIILYFLDVILLTLTFLYFGLGGSSAINSFISTPVDTSKSKFTLFLEVTKECLFLSLLVYGLVIAIPLFPSIVPLADDNHFKFRRTAELIVVSAVVFTHERLLNKIHFLIGVDA